ncbi:putative disease resistance protein [Trifolium pratense]|uniref:Putative disease resistance protein n=1 Tax=Trifolium pratense TaxID=57577 RepID=A0A2K3MLD3_TRIPR|nr:putative disease resistance protein [Trifolium pratense]
MAGCASCELPFSVVNLTNLKVITCDEETAYSWEAFQPMLPNMKIELYQRRWYDEGFDQLLVSKVFLTKVVRRCPVEQRQRWRKCSVAEKASA